ncbi:MAG TPA: phosphohistidine phosphatase SixA [Vicinamibacterales bacterium]|nr:phosphohistidine phosphatase SixA [Vicinamibacterales bacterium]
MAGAYQLFLIRHGVAEERGDAWPDDAKRPLSEDGIERFQKSARGLARLDVWIDVVLTSPLVRARQTADIVAAAFDPRPSIITIESLAPGGSYASLLADLEKHGRKTRIALVGHEPGIGELGARLIGSRHSFEFKKGAVCRIDVDEIPPVGPGDLRWFLTPKVMASIKKK